MSKKKNAARRQVAAPPKAVFADAVGIASSGRTNLSALIEAAMLAAACEAQADGITNPKQIHARMMSARAAVKASIEAK